MGRMIERLAQRALRHARGGHLLWVDAKGEVHDLGAYTRRDLAGLGWAVGVAYRSTRERSERTRIASVRAPAQRLLDAVRRVPVETGGVQDEQDGVR